MSRTTHKVYRPPQTDYCGGVSCDECGFQTNALEEVIDENDKTKQICCECLRILMEKNLNSTQK
jgi:hypothetical protein